MRAGPRMIGVLAFESLAEARRVFVADSKVSPSMQAVSASFGSRLTLRHLL